MENQKIEMDFLTQADIRSSINEIAEILKTGIFFGLSDLPEIYSGTSQHHRIVQKSVFIHLMILLRDLMFKSEKYSGKRVLFKDDIEPFKNVKDVTDLIKYVRDALVHLDSDNHKIESIKISFGVCIGKGNFMQIGEKLFASEYEDDIFFVFGESKIYLGRHIIRAYKEAKANLQPLLQF